MQVGTVGTPAGTIGAPAERELPRRAEQSSASRTALEAGLGEAEEQALAELDLIREALGCAVRAARTDDASLTERVLALVAEADQRYQDVHDRLLAVIACHAPVAGDLRLAIALIHVNERLQRMSAQCANIATLREQIKEGEHPSDEQLQCLATMADLADEQVAEAKRIFADRDPDALGLLARHDRGINAGNRQCFSMAVQAPGDGPEREAAMFVAMMARAIERIGDNAVDIARQAEFVVTGRLRL